MYIFSIKTVTLSSKVIRNLHYTKSHEHIRCNADVYFIPCNDWKMKYIGETVRNLRKRLYAYKCGNSNNAPFQHVAKIKHYFNFNAATMLAHIHNNRFRQIFEVSYILVFTSVNTRPRFFNLSPFFGKITSK